MMTASFLSLSHKRNNHLDAAMTLAPTLTTLDSLKAGQSATVVQLAPHAQGGIDVQRRLMELGFVPGERIRVLKRVMKGPLAVKVGESTFALRRFEAALVSINSIKAD
jgi:ferrous iron transport protein A